MGHVGRLLHSISPKRMEKKVIPELKTEKSITIDSMNH